MYRSCHLIGAGVSALALATTAAAGPITGACCFTDMAGVEDCNILSAVDCAALIPAGVYQGDDTDCGQCAFERCAELEENCQEPNIPQFPGGTILTSAATSDNFTATFTGEITSVCFWGAYIDGAANVDCDVPLPTDAVTITFYPDDPDVLPPAPDLAMGVSFIIAANNLQRTATGQEFGLGGFDETVSEYEWTATLNSGGIPVGFPVTAGNCYWIQVANDTGDPVCLFFWEVSPEFVNDPDLGDGDDASHDNDSLTQNPFDMAWCIDQDLGDLSACGLPINPACGAPDILPGEGSCTSADGSTCRILPAAACPPAFVFVAGQSCLGNCGDPNPGNPATGKPWPGCTNAECCTLVCETLPFCCQDEFPPDTGWNQDCADAAISLGCAFLLPDPCPGLEDLNCQLPDLSGHGGGPDNQFISIPSDAAFGLRVADNFTPATAGVVTEACWYGIYVDMTDPDVTVPCDPLPDDSFTVTYYLDDGNGLPGALLQQFAVTPTRGQELEIGIFPQFRYSATHEPVTVEAGQCYWIEVLNNLDGICVWEWSTAPSVNQPPGTGDEYAVLKNTIGGPPCPADCQTEPPPDGIVGINDFLAVLAQWGTIGAPCDMFGDPNGVGIQSFLAILAAWGPCPTAAGGSGFDVADGVDVDFGFCVNVELADPVICAPPLPMQQCDPGDFNLTQSLDLINMPFGFRCTNGISVDTGQARSYDLSQGTTAGQNVSVSCVDFGVSFNEGGAITVTVNVYEDPTPLDGPEDVDLVADLLGSTEVLIPARVFGGFFAAVFNPPLPVGVNTTIVVELFQPDRNVVEGWPQPPADGGDMGFGANDGGETAPSYSRFALCGVPNFTSNADIGVGFPQVQLIQQLHLVTTP